MAEEKQPRLDSWDDFSGDYIKPENVQEWPFKIAPFDVVSEYDKNNKPQLSVVFEYNGRKWKLGLNKTNQGVVRQAGLSPSQIKGKTLTFEKTRVNNPKTNQIVDSFGLTSVE